MVTAPGRIPGEAHRTPVLNSRTVNEESGTQVFFKYENLQRRGAFQFQMAYNSLAKFRPAQSKTGVGRFSSGNPAQGLALAARELGITADIVMPQDAPAAKVPAMHGQSVTGVFYDRYTQDREQITRNLA